jgi:serine/threonine-protein kinase
MVAIKVLPEFLAEDEQFRERFRREAVAIAKLRHPNILAVYDHGDFDGQLYIVTEFVEGGTFANELGRPIRLSRAVAVLRAIGSALDYAHERGILHRDVKPSNVLVTRDGSAVLGDFGLSRMMSTNERLTRLDTVVGTPQYMSPEQCAGTETGPASDQYALGVVAFEALTGHIPFEAETPAAVMLAQIQNVLPAPRSVNPLLPEGVERALMRALSKDPADRYPDCDAFVSSLAESAKTPTEPQPVPVAPTVPARAPVVVAASGAEMTSALPAPGAPAAKPRFGRRLQLIVGTLALVAVIAIGGTIYALSASRPAVNGNAQNSVQPPHGSLIYEVKLSKAAWGSGVEPSPDPTGSVTLGYSPGSIDIKIAKDGANLGGDLDAPALKNYVSHFVFRVDAGSDFEFDWRVRGVGPGEDAEVGLHIDTAQEAMTLFLSPRVGSNQALAATVSVPGLQSGKTIDLALLVNGPSISMYIDGRLVAQATETRSTGAQDPGFYMGGKSGALHIISLRYYAVA